MLLLTGATGSEPRIVIPFTIERDRIYLYATINGHEGRFLFDTGTMFSWAGIGGEGLSVARRFRTPIDGTVRYANIYWVGGIQFGNEYVRARSLLITEHDWILRRRAWAQDDGIFGMGIFEGFWVELSFSRNEIVLHRQKPIHFANANHTPLVMEDRNSTFYLPIEINGREWLMNVDTGLGEAIFFPNDIVNYTNPEDIMGRIVSNGEIGDFYLVQVNSVTVLGRTYIDKFIMNNSYIAARANWAFGTDKGLIGIRFLQNYDFLFDYRDISRGRTTGMYFMSTVSSTERDFGFSFTTEMPEPGIIAFHRSERGFTVASVLTDSLAYSLGVRPGTEITRINGKEIDVFTRGEVRTLLHRRGATSISVLNDYGEEVVIRLSQ